MFVQIDNNASNNTRNREQDNEGKKLYRYKYTCVHVHFHILQFIYILSLSRNTDICILRIWVWKCCNSYFYEQQRRILQTLTHCINVRLVSLLWSHSLIAEKGDVCNAMAKTHFFFWNVFLIAYLGHYLYFFKLPKVWHLFKKNL